MKMFRLPGKRCNPGFDLLSEYFYHRGIGPVFLKDDSLPGLKVFNRPPLVLLQHKANKRQNCRWIEEY